MGDFRDQLTRVTLLARLYRSGCPDDGAWREFVTLYGSSIYKWCRHWGLQDADAEEVTQQVLLKLVATMKDFVYDPERSFRAWLNTVTHHAWRNYAVSRSNGATEAGNSTAYEQLLTAPAREDLVRRLEDEFDQELLESAMQRVRLRVAAHNWEAFRLTAIDGIPAADAARQLQMKIANVYAAKSNVLRLLQEEVALLA
jgi:RNA polymerase sigma factor (sigma-70 family)